MSEGELKKKIKERIFPLIVGMNPKKYPMEAEKANAEQNRILQEILDEVTKDFPLEINGQGFNDGLLRCKGYLASPIEPQFMAKLLTEWYEKNFGSLSKNTP